MPDVMIPYIVVACLAVVSALAAAGVRGRPTARDLVERIKGTPKCSVCGSRDDCEDFTISDVTALYCDKCARFFAYYAFDLTPQGKKLKALERELELLQKAGDWDAVAAAFARYNESNKAALLRYSESRKAAQ